jgi:hypothetical protein
MNTLKSKAFAFLATVAIAGSVQAASFSTPVVTLDTATNLDVSWVWDLNQAVVLPGEFSSPTLSNWSAAAYGWKQPLFGNSSIYAIDVLADKQVGNVSFEYEAGAFAVKSPITYTNTATFGNRTYTLSVATDTNQANLWNIHLTGVAPIPEPGEWALMLSGFGLIALMVRRRTANAS